jgi:hypothetical protein
MRYRVGYGIAIVALLTVGCNRDRQVNADLDALNAFTAELVEKATTAQNPTDGVKAAQEYLDSKKDEIRTLMKRMGGIRGFQISKDTKERFAKSITDNVMNVMGLKIKMLTHTMRNKQLAAQLQKLVEDYTQLIKPE